MAETTKAQVRKDPQHTHDAVQKQALENEREGMFRRLVNFFKRLFGGGSGPSQPEASAPDNREGNKVNVLDNWDALSDKADQLQQTLKQELQDLNDEKPSPPEGSHPDELSAYQGELQSFSQRVGEATDRYTLAVTQLQQERDGLVAQARDNNETLPDISEMDAKLGADAEGPGHASFKALDQEIRNELSEPLAPEEVSSPNSQTGFEQEMAKGGDARFAIGDRMLEIAQQGLASGNGIDQKALDSEFKKLMPADEEGTIGRRSQMEQKTNLAFATAMTAVLQQYISSHQNNQNAMSPAELQGLREQALDKESLLALKDTQLQSIPFEANTDLRVDSFRLERKQEMSSFQEGYASMANKAELASSNLKPPVMRQFEATEGVDLIRSQEEREAIVSQVRNLVFDNISARNSNSTSPTEQVDYGAVERLLEPLTKSYEGVELTEGDSLNQLRNAELANSLLSSAKIVDRSCDTLQWPNPVSMAIATSNPSQEEIKQHYLDEDGKIDKSMIREQSEKTLASYQRNAAAERQEQALSTPSMSM